MTSFEAPIATDVPVSCGSSNDGGAQFDGSSSSPPLPASAADAVVKADIDCYDNEQYPGVDHSAAASDRDHVTADIKQSVETPGPVEIDLETEKESDVAEVGGGFELDIHIQQPQQNGIHSDGDEHTEDEPKPEVIDDEGYRVEHRYETECVSRSKEVRDLSEDCTELRMHETKEVTLEELKVKEGEMRPATLEEIRALLEAEFDGKDEVEISREVVVEEFTRVESQHEETVAGKVIANTVSIVEEHKTEEIHDSPQEPTAAALADIPQEETVPAILPVQNENAHDGAAPAHKVEAPTEKVDEPVACPSPSAGLAKDLDNGRKTPTPTPTPQKEKKRFSLFGRKKKKLPSESASFEGELDLTDNSAVDDQNKSKSKIQKRFSFGGKSNTLTRQKTRDDDKETTGKKSGGGFRFFTLKRNKPKECVKVAAENYQQVAPVNSEAPSPTDEDQEVFAIEAEGKVVAKPSKSPHKSPSKGIQGSVVASDEMSYLNGEAEGQHLVVVAIDFGTTFSGYAFSFVQDLTKVTGENGDETGPHAGLLPGPIHMMRRCEEGDPGVVNQKTPTTLLLTPNGQFHSFGFTARNFYHDLDPVDAQNWLYFEKFKMTLHHSTELCHTTTIAATNGSTVPAVAVFAHALRHFSQQALREISDQTMTSITNDDVRWVITVPAIWSAAAKQLMRQAAYDAGISSPETGHQLVIALEPEAASIYIRKLRMSQLVPERSLTAGRRTLPSEPSIAVAGGRQPTAEPAHNNNNWDLVAEGFGPGTRYIVVDCGGGTLDITVHEMDPSTGKLKELYKATGGPYGSTGVDAEFERLLEDIFTQDFVKNFKQKRPAGWVDLMIAFESRKRAACPNREQPLNVSLPFSFIDFHKKHCGIQVEAAIKKYGDKDVRWSAQGMLRLMPAAMERLYRTTLDSIKNSIAQVLDSDVKGLDYMFLVGGFAESAMLQAEVRKEFGQKVQIVIPQEASLAIVKGAVCFGLDPSTVTVRRSRQTYGVGVVRRFVRGRHPESKLIHRDGVDWCLDVFDRFVGAGDPVFIGGSVTRHYAPADRDQSASVIHIYCSDADADKVLFVTDNGVRQCGTLRLDMTDLPPPAQSSPAAAAAKHPREIQAKMTFGGTEVKVSAVDVRTGQCVRCAVDFLSQ